MFAKLAYKLNPNSQGNLLQLLKRYSHKLQRAITKVKMSLQSRSPHSSRHNSFSNLFGLSSKNQDNEVAIIERSDRHEDAQLHDLVPVTEHQHDNDYVYDEYED